MNRHVKGFSLLEVIVAMAILTIIVGAAIPVISAQVDRSKRDETKEELNALKIAVEGYFHDVWALPGDLNELLMNNAGVSGWVGPYINPPLDTHKSTLPVITKDAWNNDYTVTYPSASRMDLASPGPDGAFATPDDISIQIDVTFIRRKATLEEVEIINHAINAYNSVYLETDPLIPNWTLIFQKLQATGFLPSGDPDLATDGWGSDYIPDPPGMSPVVRITSPNL